MRARTINSTILRLRKVTNSLSAKFLCGALIASLLFASCKKDTSDIGLPLLGDQLEGIFTDTMTVITHTKKNKPLKTGLPAAILCGNYYDPIFGTTSASFYAELAPQNIGTTVTFGATPVIDSVVLSLTYKSYYGNPAPLNFKVFQVTDTINKGTLYYSTSVKPYNSIFPLANVILEPNTVDSVHADGKTYGPQLRIHLDKTLLSGLVNTSSGIYNSTDAFRAVFPGIYVAAYQTNFSGARAIYSFNQSDPHSKLTVYYHDQAVFPVVPETFDFQMTATTGRFNHFDHDYTSAPNIQTQIADTDINQESVVYAQGLAGLQVKLQFPYLNQLKKDGKVAINEAEIIVKADPSTMDSYLSAPTSMVLVALDDTDGYLLTPDLQEGGTYAGGTYDATRHEYRFNIARYLQGVLTGAITDHGLMIIPSNGAIFANRVVLGGGAVNSPYRMRLKLTYTKL